MGLVLQALEANSFLSHIRWRICFGLLLHLAQQFPMTCYLSPELLFPQDLNEGTVRMRERGLVFFESFSVPSSCQVLSSQRSYGMKMF